jgi:hypothetical protein
MASEAAGRFANIRRLQRRSSHSASMRSTLDRRLMSIDVDVGLLDDRPSPFHYSMLWHVSQSWPIFLPSLVL